MSSLREEGEDVVVKATITKPRKKQQALAGNEFMHIHAYAMYIGQSGENLMTDGSHGAIHAKFKHV